jgi:hypothetical protein
MVGQGQTETDRAQIYQTRFIISFTGKETQVEKDEVLN